MNYRNADSLHVSFVRYEFHPFMNVDSRFVIQGFNYLSYFEFQVKESVTDY